MVRMRVREGEREISRTPDSTHDCNNDTRTCGRHNIATGVQ